VEGEAEATLQYVEVLDDTEGAQANIADEGKPGASDLVFKFCYTIIYGCLCI
jgi:hypothetical protein